MALGDLTADQIDGHEPQRINNALLQFNLAGIIGYGTFSGGSLTSQAPNSSTLLLSIDSFPLPELGMSTIELGYLNETRKFVNRPSYSGMQISFKDFVDVDTAGNAYLWYTASHNPATGQTFYKSNYAVQGLAIVYPPDGSTNGHSPRQWTLWNCICTSYSAGQTVSMEGDQNVLVSINITIDKIYPTVYTGGTNY
jgi:hypothetical protein